MNRSTANQVKISPITVSGNNSWHLPPEKKWDMTNIGRSSEINENDPSIVKLVSDPA